MSRPPQNPNSSSNQSTSIPQQLKLTDFLRPVFQEANMIREYCLFAQIQEQYNPIDNQSLFTASQETLNSGGVKMLTGVYCIPSAQSHYLWFGLLCIDNERSSVPSPFNGGVFRFFIRFPENYPSGGLPLITFLPTTSTSHPLTSQPQFNTVSSHPDINPTTGQFNLRAFMSSSSSGSPHVPRIYKILRVLRKSFYRQFTDIDPSTSVNPNAAELSGRDHTEFIRNCGVDADESLKSFKDVDRFLLQKFGGDMNLVLLGGEQEGQSNGVTEVDKGRGRVRTLGLSFM